MHLVIFDIDGTLTDTTRIDEAGFEQTLAEEFGLHDVSSDWSIYRHCVDSWIVSEVFQQRSGRPATIAELERFQQRFVRVLEAAYVRDATLFRPIVGAPELLAHLRGDPTWAVALATGGFRATAEFKLRRAGLSVDDVAAAFADDGVMREQIVRTALRRALDDYGVRHFERVVAVGDGRGDVHAARNLHLGFVGRGTGTGAERLRQAGAQHVLPDYADLSYTVETLRRCATPGPAR